MESSLSLDVVHILCAVDKEHRVCILSQDYIVESVPVGNNRSLKEVLIDRWVSLSLLEVSSSQLFIFSCLFEADLGEPLANSLNVHALSLWERKHDVLHRVECYRWQLVPCDSKNTSLLELLLFVSPEEFESLFEFRGQLFHHFNQVCRLLSYFWTAKVDKYVNHWHA